MAALKDGHQVRLVPFAPEHGDKVFAWYYDIAYQFFFRDFDRALTLDDCRNFNKLLALSGVECLVVQHIASGEIIGLMTHACLKRKPGVAKLGILLDQTLQHKTLAIEAIIILCDYLYHRLQFNKIIVEVLATDAHVRRITEKGGWTFEATLVKEAVLNGALVDEARYYLLKDQFDKLYGTYLN